MTKKGFTLIELMIAIILFAGAMIPILLAVNKGLFATTYMEHRLIATHLTINELEDLEKKAVKKWKDVKNKNKKAIKHFPTFQREILISDPTGGGEKEFKEVRATVYWTDKEENSVTLVTYFVKTEAKKKGKP